MKRWYFPAILLGFMSGPVAADYNAGFAAYVRGDYAVAMREWRPLAEAGNTSAQRNLAVMFRDGRGVEEDIEQALAWLTRAAQAGNASSQYELGKLYERADFAGRDRALALRWFEAAAGQGHANAMLVLAKLHREDDPDAALRWLETAASAGVASAQIELGDRYRDGLGVPRDRELARQWYQSAAKLGNEYAGERLRGVEATIVLTSRGAAATVLPRAPAETEATPRPEVGTADAGSVVEPPLPGATVTLQVASGNTPSYAPQPRPKPVRNPLSDELPRFAGPVSKPFTQPIEDIAAIAVAEAGPVEGSAVAEAAPVVSAVEAEADLRPAEVLEKAPDRAVVEETPDPGQPAIARVATADGETVAPRSAKLGPEPEPAVAFIGALDAYALGDYARAVEIWEILAEGGLPEAQSNLGAMYDKGLFVAQDFGRAVGLFRAAAEQGLASAQFNLGIMYAEGRGVLKDIEAAAGWHRQAAVQGHPLAAEYLAAIVRADQVKPQEREVVQAPAAELLEPEPAGVSDVSVVAAVPPGDQQPETIQQASASEEVFVRLPAVEPDAGVSVASLTIPEVEQSVGAELAYDGGLAAFAAGDYGGAAGIWEPMAEGGHLNAMFGLGLLLDQGLGVLPDADRAYQLLTIAADRGHPDARHYLTTSGTLGSGDRDLRRDAELVRQTTRGVLVEGERKLAAFSDFVLAGAEPYPAWKFWLRQTVGYVWRPWAKFDEARDAYRDRLYAQAFNAWREVALDGVPAAQNNIGVMYANGQGTGRDLIAAAGWFQRAAQQGEPVAVLNQGLAGLVRNDTDPQAVVGFFRRAAALGVSSATYNLGAAYVDGFGVPQSMNEAALAFRAAADRGDALAVHNLAVMYERGISFPQNIAEALSLYRSAANSGEVRAQVALGLRYAKGDGVIQNNRAAADLLRPAAEAGDPIAQYNLGVLYAFGYSGDLIYAFNDGVAEDLARAQHWLTLAAVGGVTEAGERLGALSLRQNDQDRARAERLIEQSRLEALLN